jgi:thiamine-monophosphate kinase
MDEFSLIDRFFKSIPHHRNDVIFGIGDDAACLAVPSGHQLLVSCDTLISDVHFCHDWDPYDIACKAMMVNISDMAAMAAIPCWVTLALTCPELDETWLSRFSQGIRDSLAQFNIALIGGDTTRGPLSITVTIHGLVPEGQAVRRSGAQAGDRIYVSGELGAAALAVDYLSHDMCHAADKVLVMNKLQHPNPRVDLGLLLRRYATAAIDVSDGLSADLHHICVASHLGALLTLSDIPVHPLVTHYKKEKALDFALSGGDDYEVCFTVSRDKDSAFLAELALTGLQCYPIGIMIEGSGLRVETSLGESIALNPQGYCHF